MDPSSESLKKLTGYANAGFIALGLAMGAKTGLFDVIAKLTADGSWKNSQQIAVAANLKERYVREWCKAMGCADVLSMDDTGEQFRLSEQRVKELHMTLPYTSMVPMMANVFGDIEACFRPDGPNGVSYDKYTDFHAMMNNLTASSFSTQVLPCVLKQVPDLDEQLQRGIVCLDIGCGLAEPSRHLASKYPNSTFYAIDFSSSSIGQAKARVQTAQLSNVHLYEMDAAQLDAEWTAKFDWVTAVDAIHDQAYPRRVLKEISRVLKPDGRFSMLDVTGTSNAHEDKTTLGEGHSASHYIASLFHCMPVSLYFDGGEGLGTMWGARTAETLLKEAGFHHVNVLPTDSHVLTHYLARNAPAHL